MWKKIKNRFFYISGFILLGVGFVGIFIPLLPTTPLVLLAAWFFAKSSPKYHRWLRNNRYFGETLRAWESGEGLTVSEKLRMVFGATVFIGLSFFLCPNSIGRVVLLIAWLVPIGVAIFTKKRK